MRLNTANVFSVLRKYDYTFLGIAFAIFIMGVVNLYSATHASTSARMSNLYLNQMIWYCISVGVALVVSFISPKNLYRFSFFFYGLNIILLVLVLVLGHKGMGATRWLAIGPLRLQPSELTKVCVILALARYFSRNNADQSMGFKELIKPFIIAVIPAFLIIIEPDLGTGLLVVLIFFFIAFYRKLRWKTLFILFLLGIVGSVGMFNFGLKEYQKKRVIAFVNPGEDARGSGYNAIQSKIAIGSGQFWGKGFKKSSQASLNYLPENHTDFVFSIFNEEHGFVGSLFLLALYFVLFLRFIWLAHNVNRIFEAVVVVGLLSVFFWHTFINMGMVMGLLPIVGLPLPLMSYGGSSLLTFGIIIGIATSISNSRNLF